MASDAELALAFVSKRQGGRPMPEAEWCHVLSLELGWMPPGAAKSFVKACTDAALLTEADNGLGLGFDASALTIPRGFKPPTELDVVASAPAAPPPFAVSDDPFVALLDAIVAGTDLSKDEVLNEVRVVQEQFGGLLTGEAAAAYLLRRHNVEGDPAKAALASLTATA